MLYNFNLFNNLQKVKSPHYWVGLTSLPGGRLAGTGGKARPACYVSGSGTNSVQCAMLYPIGLYYQTLPILLQPILADNNFNRNFHSVTRKNNRHDRYVPSVLDLGCRSLLLCFGTFCYVPFYMC